MRLMAITRIRHETHSTAYDRSQVLLLPEAVDGLRGLRDNPVRFIDAFVRLVWTWRPLVSSALAAAIKATEHVPATIARRTCCKLYIYGVMLNSPRTFEPAGWRLRASVISKPIWLLRRLIARLRRRSLDAFTARIEQLRAAFRQVVSGVRSRLSLRRTWSCSGRELEGGLTVHFKAVNSRERNLHQSEAARRRNWPKKRSRALVALSVYRLERWPTGQNVRGRHAAAA